MATKNTKSCQSTTFGEIKNQLVFISHDQNTPELINLEEMYKIFNSKPEIDFDETIKRNVAQSKVSELSEKIDNWQLDKTINAFNIVPIIVNKLKDNSLQVIDGKSRILALYKSQADDFQLSLTILDDWSIIDTVKLYIDLHQNYTRLTKSKIYNDLFWNRREH